MRSTGWDGPCQCRPRRGPGLRPLWQWIVGLQFSTGKPVAHMSVRGVQEFARATRRGKCQLLVAHDSEHPDYGYEPGLAKFKYRYNYTRLLPGTTVVSDTDPLDWLDDALRPLW